MIVMFYLLLLDKQQAHWRNNTETQCRAEMLMHQQSLPIRLPRLKPDGCAPTWPYAP